MAGRCSCRHHRGPMAATDASHAPKSVRSHGPQAAACAVPAARRPQVRGQPRLPTSLAPNSAPTRAVVAAGGQPGTWHPALHR